MSTTAQHKWLVKLMGFDFHIGYKKGVENQVADALSRRAEMCSLTPTWAATTLLVPQWLKTIREEVSSNPKLQVALKQIQTGSLSSNHWRLDNEVIFYKNRIYLSEDSSLVPIVINEYHTGTHEGFVKTLHRIRSFFFGRE